MGWRGHLEIHPASAPPEDIVARDVGRMAYTLNMLVGLVEHISPQQFVERAERDAIAKTAAAWLAWLAGLPSESQSRSWHNLAPIGCGRAGRDCAQRFPTRMWVAAWIVDG